MDLIARELYAYRRRSHGVFNFFDELRRRAPVVVLRHYSSFVLRNN